MNNNVLIKPERPLVLKRFQYILTVVFIWFLPTQDGLAQVVIAENIQWNIPDNVDLQEVMISVDLDAVPLDEAIYRIGKKAGVTFNYNSKILPAEEYVSYKVEQESLAKVLEDILSPEIEYLTVRNIVILQKKESNNIEVIQETITGQVMDAETKEALPGVNILIDGTSTGTTTDIDGRFELVVQNLEQTLVVTYIGYERQEIAISERTDIVIELIPDIIAGEELIVVGYGTQRRIDVTSSISSVSSEDLVNQPIQQLGEALQGRMAGVQVNQSSGSPGAPLAIRIRGIGTVNQSDPLFVVDGNAGVDPANLNPNQIESIQVLKSSSAAAIYGARGANGVVMITTKSGVAGTSNLDLNFYSGVRQVHNRIEMMSGQQYARTYNEALVNADIDPLFHNVETLGAGTDWQDAIFRTGSVRNIDLSFSGGSEGGSYYIGGGYYQEEGTVIKSDYNRLSFRINSHYDINSLITLGENFSISYSTRNSIPGEYGSRSLVPQALRMDPTAPVTNPDGSWGFANFSDAQNPVADAFFVDNVTTSPVLNGSFYVDIKPLETLIYHTQVNVNYSPSLSNVFTQSYNVTPLHQNFVSNLNRNLNLNTYWDWDNTLTFDTTLGSHDLDIMGGVTVMSQKSENISARGENLPDNANLNPNLRYLNLAPDGPVVGGGAGEYSMLSLLGRVNYGYDDTYLFTGNFRFDGSSKFGRNNRWGAFPSFSLGWRISNENFMDDLTFIDELKIRGGWGMLGNQSSLPNYAFTSSLTPNLVYVFGDTPVQGQAPVSVGNPDLKWESTRETDLGFDFAGFGNRITITGNYYHRNTSDMLLRVPVMAITGISQAPFVNGGDIVNRGFELEVGYRNSVSGDFYYDISMNVSRNINKVTRLSNQLASIISGVSRTVEGGSIANFYGYVADGIFQTQEEVDNHAFQTSGTAPGDIRFRDLNNDGVIDQNDRTNIGNPWPDYTYGLSSMINWKQFDLRVVLQGVFGSDVYSSWKTFTQGSNFYNYDSAMLNAWNEEGSSSEIPRLNSNDPNDNFRASSYLVQDGSYLRLKNLQVGYTFPTANFLSQMRELRIYISAQNLLTITNYDGFDPEVGVVPGAPLNVGNDQARYPQPRTLSMGLSLGI